MFDFQKPLLVLDDSQNVRKILNEQLESLGFKVIISLEDATRGMKVLDEQLSKGTPVQAILADLNMPGPSGLDFLKDVRTRTEFRNLPFILVTTESEKGARIEATQYNLSSYIEKPFNAAKLHAGLKEAFDRSQR